MKTFSRHTKILSSKSTNWPGSGLPVRVPLPWMSHCNNYNSFQCFYNCWMEQNFPGADYYLQNAIPWELAPSYGPDLKVYKNQGVSVFRANLKAFLFNQKCNWLSVLGWRILTWQKHHSNCLLTHPYKWLIFVFIMKCYGCHGNRSR